MDRLRIREAIYYTLYSLDRDLQWYLKRAAARKREDITGMLTEFLNLQVRMLAPFAPFTAEEVWELMGNRQSITTVGWPVVEEEKIDIVAEESEFLISSLLEDVQNIVRVTKIKPTKIVIYASAAWKVQVYNAILANILEGRINFGQIMKQLIANPETVKAKSDPKMVQKMIEDILSAPLEARNRRLKLTAFNESSIPKKIPQNMTQNQGQSLQDLLNPPFTLNDISAHDSMHISPFILRSGQ
jgi:leucyl-tRNA synthetase